MPERRLLSPGDEGFPARLAQLDRPPCLTVAGSFPEVEPLAPVVAGRGPRPIVAIVGTRKPCPDSALFARDLAGAVAVHGGIVASGGAIGIDTAAHQGALDAGGTTWVVAATGANELFPAENAELFDRVLRRGGAMVWPFNENRKADLTTFFARNGVLVALCDAVVVIQAGIPSGALNTAAWARKLGRPVWAVCAPPWMPGFVGNASLIELGARPLASVSAWMHGIGLVDARRRRTGGSARTPTATPAPTTTSTPDAIPSGSENTCRAPRTPDELALLGILSPSRGQHIDEITTKSRLSTQEVMTVLLTLALENVVVEGPEGLFRLSRSPFFR